MKLFIRPSTSLLIGEKENLEKIHNYFSFTDKAAENDLIRFKKAQNSREKEMEEISEAYLRWKHYRIEEMKRLVHVFCCSFQDDQLLIPTGLLPSLYREFKDLNWKEVDERNFALERKELDGLRMNLRKPQKEALEILTGDNPNHLKCLGLIKIATGVGKTTLAVELIRKFGVRSIFLVPSLSILEQTVKRFEEAFGRGNVSAYGGGKKKLGWVTVATYQSVNLAPSGTFDEIDLIAADEVHHIASDTFFNAVHNQLRNAILRFGFSAENTRADNCTMLIEAAIGPVVYSYSAAQAIADKYLAKPTFVIYNVLDTQGKWTKYKTRGKERLKVGEMPSIYYNSSDEMIAYRNWVLGNDILNNFVAQLSLGFTQKGKSVLILVDEKEHGEKLMKLIPEAGYAFGGNSDNEGLQRRFNEKELKVLIGTSCLSEGSDLVPVDVLIELQGGQSYSKTLQADGRALRNDPDKNGVPRKPNVLIIDFDFPHCKILERHSRARQKVHRTMGEVHQLVLR